MSLPRRQSLQGNFALVYSGDPSLQPRPADLPDEATAEAKEQRKDDQAQWDKGIEACRETGNWTPMLVPGAQPTTFRFELPKGEARRSLLDMYMGLLMEGRMNTAAARLFRATCKAIDGDWPGPKVKFVKERGAMLLDPSVIDFLDDEVTPALIGEMTGLGGFISERLKGLTGKL